MSDEQLFAQVIELGRRLGWHDGSGRSRHQEYTSSYYRKCRRREYLSEDVALTRHADALTRALLAAALAGGEIATLTLGQQQDDTPWIRRPRHILSFEDPVAQALLRRKRVDLDL